MTLNRRIKPKLTARDQQNAVNKSMRALEIATGKSFGMDLSDKAPPAPRVKKAQTRVIAERDVQKAIIEILLVHPMVGLVERINSGVMQNYTVDGEARYTKFNHVYGKSSDGHYMRIVDICVTLKNGPWAGKRLVIDAKKSDWTHVRSGNDTEVAQAAYMQTVRECGGYGIFAPNVECVIAELDRIRREA